MKQLIWSQWWILPLSVPISLDLVLVISIQLYAEADFYAQD